MTSRSVLVNELFSFLERTGISYVVMGDSQKLPHQVLGDIDIVIDPQNIGSFCELLCSSLVLPDIRVVQILQHEQTAWYFVLANTDKKGGLLYVQPDVCSNYFREGRLILEANDILAGRYRKTASENQVTSFYVPSPAMAFIYYLIKKIEKGELTDGHGCYLASEWEKDPSGAIEQLAHFWPSTTANLLKQAAATNDWLVIQKAIPTIKKQLRNRLPISLRHWYRDVMRKIHRIRQPTGLHVVFLGPDGSGKSTVLAHVQQVLAPLFRKTKNYHLRPYFGKAREHVLPNLNPHQEKPRDKLSSLAKLGLWWADFTIGYALEVFPRLVRSTLILFDRYYHDLLIDPYRYRYGGPVFLAKMLENLIPSPDLFILLDAPAEVMQFRKNEVSFEETDRQRKLYLEFISRKPNGHVVNCNMPLSMVVEQVNQIILGALHNRVNKRLRRSSRK